MTNTIDALKNLIDGKPPVETRLGGPDAPYRKELDEAQLLRADVEKAQLQSKLRIGTWIVEFTKVDGSPSIMECTLDSRLLPPAEPGKIATSRPEKRDLLHVYAIDRDPPGWRSFKVLNVTKVYQRPQDL